MKDIRLMQMERYLSEVGYATIQQLWEKSEIHPNTARSDIKERREGGVAEKKYGGVGYASTKLPEGYYEQRRETNKKSKESIGYKALALLEELAKKYPQRLKERYGIEVGEPLEMLEGVCRRRGFMLRGGEYDYERAERAVIDDFRKGRLGGVTLDEMSDCDGFEF